MVNKWNGWKRQSPSKKQRNKMFNACGKKCFLGSKKSFPICTKHTCTINKKGVYSAYIRSRQYRSKSSKYYKISKKARDILLKLKTKK
jgi:hypothetical protein